MPKELIVADSLTFPTDFLWGAATAAHQVEGDNRNSDWWEWESDGFSKVPLAEPSGSACDLYEDRFLAEAGGDDFIGVQTSDLDLAAHVPAQGRRTYSDRECRR
jgi:beta-glucosidase/6-phospho-beta-glucosidase/beta-galactosidase